MSDWPELRIDTWRDSYATLLLYTQMVGKVRMALVPKMNQWWNVTLYLTTRGLTTAPMPYRGRTVSIDFDFVDHRLLIQDSEGHVSGLELEPRPVCDFHDALFGALAKLGVEVQIGTRPQECPVTVTFPEDHEHSSYDPAAVHQFWQALRRVEPVFQSFRSRFRGKCSPVHFFWGAFDLAVTRFSGRRAPLRAAKVDRDAYDEEVSSLGFWPGDPWKGSSEAMFYSYTAPAPAGFAEAKASPAAAFYSGDFKEFFLPYEAVRRAADPGAVILEFAESTYDAGSTLGAWDRAALAYP
jgi:hypothetical protein